MTMQPTHPLQTERTGLAERLVGHLKSARGVLQAWRTPLFVLAGAVFLLGLIYSAIRIELTLADIDMLWLAVGALVFVPIAFAYGAVNFVVMARGAGVSVPFARAFKISCIAVFAEFLPIPGGAMVRGGAMIQAGSGMGNAAAHVTVNAVLWIACAAVAAGFALGLDQPAALIFGAVGLAATLGCTAWLWSKAGAAIALTALALRIIGLFIAGARIFATFLTIGVAVGILDLYPFVFATILGSAAAIAPGGLGISEAVAAAIATLSTVPPEAAFIAVAVNRMIGFAISGIATFFITFYSKSSGSHQA